MKYETARPEKYAYYIKLFSPNLCSGQRIIAWAKLWFNDIYHLSTNNKCSFI